MPHVSYIANGFCMAGGSPGDMSGLGELRFWNPTDRPTTVRMTVYFSEGDPVDLPPYEIGPQEDPLLVFPDNYPDIFGDCGPWGMRLVSDTMLLADHILVARQQGQTEEIRYSGGVGDTLTAARPSRVWYFADGIRLIWEPESAPWPFNEYEWYHILNPGKRSAHVTMQCVFGSGSHREIDHEVGPESVLMFDNFDAFTETCSYGIRFISDEPVVVQSERVIYGLHGLEEWGAQIHCQRPGLPAPLEWNEDGLAD
jgi:hypothetical protein